MVSAGVKNELSEEHADSTSESLLEITMELLKNIDFEKESVILVGRSEWNLQWSNGDWPEKTQNDDDDDDGDS